MYASDAAKRHVRFTGKETEPNLTFGKGERVPDLIDGNQLKDIKHVSGALGKDVETQLADFQKLVDRELNVGGTIYELDTLTVVLTEPSGVRANAEYMAKMVDDPRFKFEIFNSRGERMTINRDTLSSTFNPGGGPEGLAAAIKAWAQ